MSTSPNRYHQPAWFARRLGPHVAEIPFFSLAAIEPPKTILNVPLGHEYNGVVVGLRKRMNDPFQGVTQLVYCPSWCEFCRCVIDGLDDAAVFEPQRKREVQDQPICP